MGFLFLLLSPNRVSWAETDLDNSKNIEISFLAGSGDSALPGGRIGSPDPISNLRGEETNIWKALKEKLEIDGFLKNESAIRARAPIEFTKLENTFQLELTYHISRQIDLFATIRTFYDAVWDVEDDFDRESRHNLSTDFDLREAYIDIFLKRADIRIGRQQVIWGEADGLKTLDVVNPQDFKEFILDDFEDSRIPLWMVKADTFWGEYTLQLVWIPDLRFHELEKGSEFDFFRPSSPGIQLIEHPPVEPPKTFGKSEWGIRLARNLKGWDLTLNYFHNYEDFPIFFRRFSLAPQTQLPTLILRPRHTRFHILGGTFAKPMGQLVMRGEVTYNLNRYFRTNNPLDRDGVQKRELLNYVVALDYDIPRHHLFLSTQLFQRIIPNYDHDLLQDRVESVWSLLGRMDFFHEAVIADFLVLYGLNNGEALFRAKVAYDITDTWRVTIGTDFFEGERDEFFGQFDSRDRITFKLEYNF